MPDELPLAAASARLRRKPGRPKKEWSASITGEAHPGTPRSNNSNSGTVAYEAVGQILPRLLDLRAAAAYLGVSPWTVRDLEANGTLRRVNVPSGPGRDLRKLLFDRQDLDQLVETWKAL
jgi:hypothetical protein